MRSARALADGQSLFSLEDDRERLYSCGVILGSAFFHANTVGVAIGGASDITGNAGTIIVGSYRKVRASASDGTSIRIGRYASATVISALLNGLSVRIFCVSLSVGDIAVCVGSVVVIYACGFARGQPLSEIFCRAFTCWSFLVG